MKKNEVYKSEVRNAHANLLGDDVSRRRVCTHKK